MKTSFTKRFCRAGVIAALYTATTYAFMPLAFGPIQVRPAEALCILPLFFPEAMPALWIGCMLSNLASPYLFYDVVFGAGITLVSSFFTYLVGIYCKKDFWKLLLGGLSPALCNALFLPVLFIFLLGDGVEQSAFFITYLSYAISLFATECLWIYGLGAPLYFSLKRLAKNNR